MHTSIRRVDYLATSFSRHTAAPQRPLRRSLLAGLCMLLVLLAGTLSVTHSHPITTGIHPDCGLCVVAHMAIHAAAEPPSAAAFHAFTDAPNPEPILQPPAAIHPALYSRPPPADAHRS